MIIKDNMASMCAKVTSTYMEFTLAFGPKPEFSFSFKYTYMYTMISKISQQNIEHIFFFIMLDTAFYRKGLNVFFNSTLQE